MKRRFLVDVDGVLADFVSAYLDIVRAVTGRSHSPEHVTEFDIGKSLALSRDESSLVKRTLGNSQGIARELGVYPGAREGLAALREVADVYIVTSPWNSNPTWTHDREAWLEKHFRIKHDRVIHTSAKYVCCGDVLVDDKVSAVEQWQAAHSNGIGVVWDTLHNQRDSFPGLRMRTSSWSLLLALATGGEP